MVIIMLEQHNIERKESWQDEYLKWTCGIAKARVAKTILVL